MRSGAMGYCGGAVACPWMHYKHGLNVYILQICQNVCIICDVSIISIISMLNIRITSSFWMILSIFVIVGPSVFGSAVQFYICRLDKAMWTELTNI